MGTNESIKHEGIIESVEQKRVVVRILSESACSACHAKGACNAADLKEKKIEISTDNYNHYVTGQKVVITGYSTQGYKAVLYAYLIPTLLVMASLIIVYNKTGNDILAAISSLVLLIPYFMVLFLFRKKLQKTFSFKLDS